MGGVDLADMLIALYRTELKGHRWYLPLVSQILDMCVINGWLLYRRDCAGKRMSLKKYRYTIIQNLLMHGRDSGTNKDHIAAPTAAKRIKVPTSARPTEEVRFDHVGHFPNFGTKGRCKLCTKGETTVICTKCSLRLCLLPDRNCFVAFHTKM